MQQGRLWYELVQKSSSWTLHGELGEKQEGGEENGWYSSDYQVLVNAVRDMDTQSIPSWEASHTVARYIQIAQELKETLTIRHIAREGLTGPHKLANWDKCTTKGAHEQEFIPSHHSFKFLTTLRSTTLFCRLNTRGYIITVHPWTVIMADGRNQAYTCSFVRIFLYYFPVFYFPLFKYVFTLAN